MQHRLGILGFGKMGEALIQGLRKSALSKDFVITGTTRSAESAADIKKRLGIDCFNDNAELVANSQTLILSVKPQQAEAVLKSISKKLKKNQTLISICAALSLKQLEEWSGGKAAIVRAMPNTPCLVGEGMTVLVPGARAGKNEIEGAQKIFETTGRVVTLEDESLLDGVTGLSGCGPAYVYLVIEALSEAGVKVGLPRKMATLLAAQTLLGASKMVLELGVHPAALKDEVTTPSGCTIEGLMALEDGKLRMTLIKAVWAATKRSRELRET